MLKYQLFTKSLSTSPNVSFESSGLNSYYLPAEVLWGSIRSERIPPGLESLPLILAFGINPIYETFSYHLKQATPYGPRISSRQQTHTISVSEQQNRYICVRSRVDEDHQARESIYCLYYYKTGRKMQNSISPVENR